ncbi:MAG TPA: hypothetical protein VLE69_04175, partial [Candidatus Saccharimonadales bacterium]|nr:hypothetical protein [Candidatus Saccharimonadales bacterium]
MNQSGAETLAAVLAAGPPIEAGPYMSVPTMEPASMAGGSIFAELAQNNLHTAPVAAIQPNMVPAAVRDTNERHTFRNGVIGSIAGVALMAAAVAGVEGRGNEHRASATPVVATTPNQVPTVDVCKNGIYPHMDPYFAQRNVLPEELHDHPPTSTPLTDVNDTMNFFFGADGKVCDSAPTNAAMAAISADLLGGGGPGNVFATTDMNAVKADLAQHPDKALATAKANADVYKKAQ